jgi:hypothetical protein
LVAGILPFAQGVPAQVLHADAFVLLKRLPSDSFQALTVFSAEHGVLQVQQRLPRGRANTGVVLDLFDEVTLILESSNQGRSWFVKEARLVTRHTELGRNYDALRLASSLAALLARNPVHEESRVAAAQLLGSALAAFTGPRPDIVYFKSLYRFARNEGYPMKEQWVPTLTTADRAEVATLLNRPMAEQIAAPEVVARLQRRMEDYLRGHTEILLE